MTDTQTHTTREVVAVLVQAWEGWSKDRTFPFARSASMGYCINATRTGIDALAAFGVKAKPASVTMMIANKPAIDLMNAGVVMADWPDHAWSILLGHGDGSTADNGWNGHLIIDADECAIDLSAETLHRPGRIAIDGPLVFAALPRIGEPLTMTSRDLTVIVERTPQHNGWRQASGWKNRTPQITAALVERMRKEVAK